MVEPAPDGRATLLLQRWCSGDEGAGEELAPLVEAELRRLARGHLRGALDGTLQPTALVNEAWLRLMRADELEFASRGHFYALASHAMRSLLVDHARRKNAERRGGGRARITLDERLDGDAGPEDIDVLAIHEALERLSELDEELGRLVELRFFGGLEMEAVAAALGLSKRTAERRWRAASAWLRDELEEHG